MGIVELEDARLKAGATEIKVEGLSSRLITAK